MTEGVKNFLEVNAQLLDINQNEFFHIAYNGLTIPQQKELVSLLDDANIDVAEARENFIRFHIGMTMETIERPIALETFIKRYEVVILGFDYEWLFDYIINNSEEWADVKITKGIHGIDYLFPALRI